MPWHQIEKGQSLSDLAQEYGISPAVIWQDPHNKKFAGGHTDGWEIFLPGDQWIFIPEPVSADDGQAQADTQSPDTPTEAGATPPIRTRGRANAIWTRSHAGSVFRRPRANAVTQDDARFVLPVARKSFKAAFDAHNGKMAKLKGFGRYHSVSFKESRWRKGAVTATGVVVPVVGFIAGSAATGGLLIPLGLGVMATRYVLKSFYHHRDYKRRSSYYERDMYCTPKSKRKHPGKYEVKKEEAERKWWRRALIKITPQKYEGMVRVKDNAYEESEFWRVRLIRDADQCIRPSVVHMRKAQYILLHKMGGFFKSVDPDFSDPQNIIKKEGIDTSKFDSFSRCDDYIEHGKTAMQYLHEVDKFRTYLLPALNMSIFFLDRFLSLAHGWRIQQRKVEDAIDRFFKAGDHTGCKWHRKVRNILEPGTFKSLLAAHPHLNVRCYQKEKRPDIYLFTGQSGGNGSSESQSDSSSSGSGSGGGTQFKTVEAVELREHLVNVATIFQNEIQANKNRMVKPESDTPQEGSQGELRYPKMLADLASIYESPSKLDALSHRVKNYNMSSTKLEKATCFAEFGLSVAKSALGGGFISEIAGWEDQPRPPVRVGGLLDRIKNRKVSMEQLAAGARSKGGKGASPKEQVAASVRKAADPAAKAAINKGGATAKDRQAAGSTGGGSEQYCQLGDNGRHLIIESDVLKSLKSEFNVKDAVTRIARIEDEEAREERRVILEQLDEMEAKGELTGKDRKIAEKQLDHLFVHHGKQAKKAAIGVERIFKQLDFHYKKARDYHRLFLAIDDMAIGRKEWPIRLRSCRQCYQYAYNLYEFHHELEKVERYLLASATIVAELAEEAATFAAYQQPVWDTLDGLTKQWVQSNPNHEHCLEKQGQRRQGKHCYGPAGPWKADTARKPV